MHCEGSFGVPDLTLADIVVLVVLLLFAFPVHEFAHAFVAYRLGDDTAQQAGRLTFNPLRHLDPLGSLTLIISMTVGIGIGWAKPVPVNPWSLRYGPRIGNAIVAVAGPLSNLAMATLAAIPFRLGMLEGAPRWLSSVLLTFMSINVVLMLFNLIPLAPLDGNSVLNGIVGERGAVLLSPLRTYGSLILMGLLMIGFVMPGVNLLGRVLLPLRDFTMRLLLGL